MALSISLVGSAPAARSTPTATLAFARADLAGGGVYVVGGGQVRLLRRDAAEPAWSPDGRRLAYVAAGSGGASDLFVIDQDGTHAGRITWSADVDETSPSWSPDGKRLVVERSGTIVTVRADGTGERVLASGWEPAWSPGGRLIAFSNGADLYVVPVGKGRPRRLTSTPAPDSAPAWAPDGRRLAFISEESGAADLHVIDLRSGQVKRLIQDAAVDASPVFTADGRNVIFVSDRTGVETLWRVPSAGGLPVPVVAVPSAVDPAPRPQATVAELLPDLDQQPPTDLEVRRGGSGFRVWFTSASDNVGLGPLIVNGRRNRASGPMRASQRVRLANGRLRTNPEIGTWRYNASQDHSHWHLLHFQRYEVRRPDGYVLVRDRKSGFCIGDRYGVAPGRIRGRIPTPIFRGFCNTYRPESLTVDGGTSVGYSDRYHSRLDGQNLNITHLPAGEYLLVNRVNVELRIREFRYENNAASIRIRISWPHGRSKRPAVRVLRRCPDSERC